MKKIFIICLSVALFCVFIGCSNESNDVVNNTNNTEITTTTPTTTLADISLTFPTEFTVRTGSEDLDYGFERQFRYTFYSTSIAGHIGSVSREALHEFGNRVFGVAGVEFAEPVLFSFIKYFDVAFEEFRQATQSAYLHRGEMNLNMADEENEIPNPYLLFTFNLERINDYYSLDPARHTSARLWLEEWLQENEPYASYSEFRAANAGYPS